MYKAQNISIIPITLKDNCTYDLKKESKIISTTPKLLFVGSYFPGNTKGLKWFCKKILPHVNAHLTIVGSGMEQLKKTIKIDCNKLTIHGKVDKLDSFYLNADIIILPIISGGGMKVKTAEALMWGKYIIGTKEALEGYNLNKDIAIICQTKQDFIKAINNIGSKQKYNYNEQARMILRITILIIIPCFYTKTFLKSFKLISSYEYLDRWKAIGDHKHRYYELSKRKRISMGKKYAVIHFLCSHSQKD